MGCMPGAIQSLWIFWSPHHQAGNIEGVTPVQIAGMFGHVDIFGFLVKRGADIYNASYWGNAGDLMI
jgi:hypothetical protein